jgi:5-methylcytosine-specific restriction enzyme subunit McrC
VAAETIEIHEWASTPPLELTDDDLDVLEADVLLGGDRGRPIAVVADVDAVGDLGLLGLPDGPTIEIRPKAAGDNLINLIRYAAGGTSEPVSIPTPATPGRTLIDVLATLFLDELTATVRSGLDKAYVERQAPQRFLRGQLNLVRHLQQQGPLSTELECDFEELTTDTTLNQAILYAAHTLAGLTREPALRSELSLWADRLRGHVSLRPVQPVQLNQIELTRLNDHYAELLQLTRWVLEGLFVEDLRAGAHRAFSLLLDMNQIFEEVVGTAAKRGIGRRSGWSVVGEERTQKLLVGVDGSRTPLLKPDLVVRREGDVVAVADAKWKTTVKNSDIYQLMAYQRTYDAPGLLIYPSQQGTARRAYRVRDGRRLETVELPTDRLAEGPEELGRHLQESIAGHIEGLLGSR